jgi:hypothetical protein
MRSVPTFFALHLFSGSSGTRHSHDRAQRGKPDAKKKSFWFRPAPDAAFSSSAATFCSFCGVAAGSGSGAAAGSGVTAASERLRVRTATSAAHRGSFRSPVSLAPVSTPLGVVLHEIRVSDTESDTAAATYTAQTRPAPIQRAHPAKAESGALVSYSGPSSRSPDADRRLPPARRVLPLADIFLGFVRRLLGRNQHMRATSRLMPSSCSRRRQRG